MGGNVHRGEKGSGQHYEVIIQTQKNVFLLGSLESLLLGRVQFKARSAEMGLELLDQKHQQLLEPPRMKLIRNTRRLKTHMLSIHNGQVIPFARVAQCFVRCLFRGYYFSNQHAESWVL